jgi:hypothetical protein
MLLFELNLDMDVKIGIALEGCAVSPGTLVVSTQITRVHMGWTWNRCFNFTCPSRTLFEKAVT